MADTGIDAASTEVNDFKRSIDRLAEGEVKLLAAAYLHQKESSSVSFFLGLLSKCNLLRINLSGRVSNPKAD